MSCAQCGSSTDILLVRVRREVTLGLFALGLILAYTLTGGLFHDLIEGGQRSLLPLWKVWLPAAVLLLAVASLFVRQRRAVCEQCNAVVPAWLFTPLSKQRSEAILASGLSRRVALRALGAGGATVAATAAGVGAVVVRNRGWLPVVHDFFLAEVESTAPHTRPEWGNSQIKSYRRLGRTNAMVSDISLGSSRIEDVEIARRAIDRGVTYFDTAPDYAETGSEQVLGQALKGRRDKMFLATKFCVADGHLPNDTPVPKIIEAVEGSLRRLQTDYVDLIHVHSCDRVERLMAPNIHEAFDRLKEQG